MNFQNCKWCQGAGCLVCGSTRVQKLDREAAFADARRFMERFGGEDRFAPELLPIIAEAISYGRERALDQRREQHAAAAPDRFEMLEMDGGRELSPAAG